MNGKVKLFVCTEGDDEDLVLDTHEVIAELCEPTKEDREAQRDIRSWRFEMLVTNTQALGTDYVSELVDQGVRKCRLGPGVPWEKSDSARDGTKAGGQEILLKSPSNGEVDRVTVARHSTSETTPLGDPPQAREVE